MKGDSRLCAFIVQQSGKLWN